MRTFKLSLSFDREGLRALTAGGFQVTLSREIRGLPSVAAWQVFPPRRTTHTITWQDQYGVFASTADVQPGALLTPLAVTGFPVLGGNLYPLRSNDAFGPPRAVGPATDLYGAIHEDDDRPRLTFGLFQNAEIDQVPVQGNAIAALSLPRGGVLVLTPPPVFRVSLQKNLSANTVLGNRGNLQTLLDFGDTSEVSLTFDLKGERFRFSDPGLQLAKRQEEPAAEGRTAKTGPSLTYLLPDPA
jgi:hypothetical protein